jgi:leader peptidase (prepilin peptidase)/N-methyltransferase
MLADMNVSPAVFITLVVVLGLLVGSFLNVVIHRVPVMLERMWRRECLALEDKPLPAEEPYNLVRPRSGCPGCKAPITALQNIPVVSYLALRGKCARCARPIGARYPIVELATAVLSGMVAYRFGMSWSTGAALVLTWFLIGLAVIDMDTQLLPDGMTLPLLWIGLLLPILLPAGERLPVDLRTAVIGAVAGYLSLWSVYQLFKLLTGKEGMGYGDFKLLAALGAWLGWQMLLPIIIAAAGVGAIVGITSVVLGKRGQGVPMAFGPYLAAAGFIMLMWGPALVERYLGLYGPR